MTPAPGHTVYKMYDKPSLRSVTSVTLDTLSCEITIFGLASCVSICFLYMIIADTKVKA